MLLHQILAFSIYEKMKKNHVSLINLSISFNINKQINNYELLDGSYSLSYIHDYFEYTLRKWKKD